MDVNEPVDATQQIEASAGLAQGTNNNETASGIDPLGLDTLNAPTVPQNPNDEILDPGREDHLPPLEPEKNRQGGKSVPVESHEDFTDSIEQVASNTGAKDLTQDRHESLDMIKQDKSAPDA